MADQMSWGLERSPGSMKGPNRRIGRSQDSLDRTFDRQLLQQAIEFRPTFPGVAGSLAQAKKALPFISGKEFPVSQA
jgi:hypothetical protein